MTQSATQQEPPAGGPLSSVEPWDLVVDAQIGDGQRLPFGESRPQSACR